jgi:hypothetical protein
MSLIYKYSSWGKEREEFRDNILTKSSLWFSSPSGFNDPFDSCLPMYFTDGYEGSEEYYYDLSKKFAEKSGKLVSENSLRLAAVMLVSKPRREDHWEEYRMIHTEGLNEIFGVSCFSKNPESILMWSHYADCHKGICLGFDQELLETDMKYKFLEVRYQSAFYKLSKFGDPQQVLDFLLTKFIDWKYEEEYRLIIEDAPNKLLSYNPLSLKEIIIGLKMPANESERLRSIVNDNFPHIRIRQTKRNSDGFKLDMD